MSAPGWFALSTGLCTVFVVLLTVGCWRAQRELRTTLHALRKQHTTYELMCEEFEALKRRQAKLAGRFFRAKAPDMIVDGGAFENDIGSDPRRGGAPDPFPAPVPPRDDRTSDFVNGASDSDFEAMLALQRQSAP